MSPKIRRCLQSIEQIKRHGYDLRLWTESDYPIERSPRTAAAYGARKWSLVSNYVRLDVLKRYGGIYLDTDVQVVRPFDNLHEHDFFAGFMWDCTLGTAVIGAAPGHDIISNLLDQYDRDPGSFKSPNNDTVTEYFLREVPGFKLNGRAQQVGERAWILDKYAFEHPTLLLRSNYTVHHFEASWRTDSRLKRKLKNLATGAGSLWLYRKYVCWHSRRISPFYSEFLRQTNLSSEL